MHEQSSISRRQFIKLALAGAALAACTPAVPAPASAPQAEADASQPSGDRTNLIYWTGWSGIDLEKQQTTMVDPFNQAQAEVHVEMQTVFGQYQKVLTAIAAGDPPDIISAVWLSQLSAMAARGALTDLTDHFAISSLSAEDFFPNHWEQWHYDGKLWGLAVTTSSSLYCYNAQFVAEAGLDPDQPPTDTEELDMWAEALTVLDANGNIERFGFRPAGLWLWGHVFGANFYDEATQTITANEPAVVAALEWMASYAQKWDIEKIDAFESGFGSYAGATNPFLIGLQASLITGEWMIGYAQEFQPELEPNIRYIPAPPPSGGRENVTTFGGSIFTIPNGVKAPDDSWEFIEFIQDPQIGGTFAHSIYNLQPVQATFEDPRFTSDPRVKLGLDLQSGSNAYGVLPIPVHEMYLAELTTAESFVIHGEKSAEEALNDVTALIQVELDLITQGGSGR